MILHFIKSIEVGNGFVNFYFDRIYTIEGVRYFVSVIDRETRKLFMFQMRENEGKWSIINFLNYPYWIVKLESELSNVIIDHHKEEG